MRKTSHSPLLAIAIVLVAFTRVEATTINFTNVSDTGLGAFSLADSSETLIPFAQTSNLRLGTFGSYDAQAAWGSGDLAGLNANFQQFGSTFGMTNYQSANVDGIFEEVLNGVTTGTFENEPVSFWASNGSDFNDTNAEFLIFAFSQNFPEENGDVISIDLRNTSGTLIAGEFGEYTHDYSVGDGPLPGFNTVNVVPEPATYAALAGLLALGFAMIRRRRV